jgi:hypothetical protein
MNGSAWFRPSGTASPTATKAPRPTPLEDLVFGPNVDGPPPPSTTSDVVEGTFKPTSDRVTRCMVPLVACFVVIVVVLWSLTKSMQYTELFTTNPRYQYCLWGLNVAVIVLATLFVCLGRWGAYA